jgi:two-component system, chemotaxis family, sensor kinase CheA
MKDQYREAFKEEAYELLSELESSLLELEESPDDMDIVGRVFRAMHTIKGSGAMFGFDDIAAFTHEVETVFDMVRNGAITVSPELVRHTLAARDRIKVLLDAADDGGSADPAEGERIVAALRRLVPSRSEEASEPAAIANSSGPETQVAGPVDKVTYRIRFKPAAGIFMNGTNPLALLNELRGLGDCRVVAQVCDLPPLTEMDAELCYVYWDIILTTSCGVDAIKDVFIFVEDDCELSIEIIDDGGRLDNEADYRNWGTF